ncbi:transcription initiation factor TFIID subunit 12 [Eurytemora carolleeae]|uniref:transcription initiation factor TFIID subunit 12 n=1 Tax=Eurytemora carolleeae TaxID=1294199 RepID=UPI000C77B6A9|nr:transcription initiation factor TFIID subunit 12 [Eurytemora carolleeae]|eukprot:XP_023321741.1 transcription initiation factor TFIID subunit 12-like [Eurytemora affinis]
MSVQGQTTIYPSGSGPGLPAGGISSGATTATTTTISNSSQPMSSPTSTPQLSSESQVLDRNRLGELVKEVDPSEQLDEDVEEVLLQIADDFIEQTVTQACALAKHRKANTIDVRDVQMVLERSWNLWIPGFGAQELRPYKRAASSEAHRQRLAVIKKALKKY